MTEAAIEISEADPVLDTDFAKEMVRQMRAIDTYGSYDEWSTAKILDHPRPFGAREISKQKSFPYRARPKSVSVPI